MRKSKGKVKRTPSTPKRLKQFGRTRKKEDRGLMIDASPEKDQSVLPMKINGGALASKHNLLTPDRLAEEVGGRNELVNMCRLSDAPEAIEFVRRCEVDKEVSLDNILQSQNVKLSKILGSVVPALCEYGGQVGRMMNALKSPALMKESIHVALTGGIEAYPERRMQLEVAGIVEKTKPATVIGQMNANFGGVEKPEATFLQRVEEEVDDAD